MLAGHAAPTRYKLGGPRHLQESQSFSGPSQLSMVGLLAPVDGLAEGVVETKDRAPGACRSLSAPQVHPLADGAACGAAR